MRYSSQAEAEMSFDRFMDFADRKVTTLSVFTNSNGSVEAYIVPKLSSLVIDEFDDLDAPSYCKGTSHCHCMDCR